MQYKGTLRHKPGRWWSRLNTRFQCMSPILTLFSLSVCILFFQVLNWEVGEKTMYRLYVVQSIATYIMSKIPYELFAGGIQEIMVLQKI